MLGALALAAAWAPAAGAAITVSVDPTTNVALVEGTDGHDDIHLESGSDSVYVTSYDGVVAGAYCDQIHGNAPAYCDRAPDADGRFLIVVDAGAGNDSINLGSNTGAGFDPIEVAAGPGDDYVHGSSVEDWIEGGPGNDWLAGAVGDDVVIGGGGLAAGEVAGTDTVYGGSGSDVVSDGDLDRPLPLAAGAVDLDLVDGGVCPQYGAYNCRGDLPLPDEFDVVDWSARADPVTIDLADPAVPRGREGEAENLVNVEGAIGGAGGDSLLGDDDANMFEGGPGSDELSGLDGDDYLQPGAVAGGADGADTVTGGLGRDFVSYEDRTTPVTVDLRQSIQEGDDVTSVENAVGGSAADILIGDGGANSLYGLDGGDTLRLAGDGVADEALCGPGVDVAELDAIDSAEDCDPPAAPAPPEEVTPPPPALPTPPAPLPPPGAFTGVFPQAVTLQAAGRRRPVRVRANGGFTLPYLKVDCPRGSACIVFVQVLAANGRGRPLGTKGMRIRAGTRPVFASALTRSALKKLTRRKRMNVLIDFEPRPHGKRVRFPATLLAPKRR